jgi:hypothetical protein
MSAQAETNAFDGFMNHVAMPVLFAPALLPMAMFQVSSATSELQITWLDICVRNPLLFGHRAHHGAGCMASKRDLALVPQTPPILAPSS